MDLVPLSLEKCLQMEMCMIFNRFIVLLSFSESSVTKCMFLNDKPCMVMPTIIKMNPVELKYYPFVISLNKCTGSCNVLSSKICVPKETRHKC